MLNASDRFVSLRGGLVLPVEPILLALDLEARGIRLSVDGDSLLVHPKAALTAADRAALRRWKLHVMTLVQYQPPEVAQ